MNQIITLLTTLIIASMFLIVGAYVYSVMSTSIKSTACISSEAVTFVNNTDKTFTYYPIDNKAAYDPIITNASHTFPADRHSVTGERTIKIQTNGSWATLAWTVAYFYDAAVCANTTTGALAYSTLESTDTNTFAGLNLASIAPIALAASAIMFIVIIAFAFRD